MQRATAIAVTLLSGVLAADNGPRGTTLPVTELELPNGMLFLLLPRPEMPTVEAGWVVTTGSAFEAPGATGASHLIEHMLFKGTRTIGARDMKAETGVLARLDEVELEMRALPASGRRAQRRHRTLETERLELEQRARALTQLGAFSLEYSRAGATRLNANTAEDLTLYYVTVPAEKLELWFWLESDRLLHPVFRELTKEKQVIAEERRLRIASTPTGEADRAFDEAFWQGGGYGHSTLGRPEDVERLTRSDVRVVFDRHYRPENLTAVLVGNFELQRVEAMARTYFGRLPADAPASPPPRVQPALDRRGEQRLRQSCKCPEQVRIRYPTVSFGHPDQFSLQALAGVLNGRAGRLYRRLVLGREIAFSAYAQQTPLREAGFFTATLEAKGGTPLDELVAAWDAEVEQLTTRPPPGAELRRAQRRLATENLDQLKDPHYLMRRLLVYSGLGDWRQLGRWSDVIAAVEPQAIQDVARRYLTHDRRLVGYYERTQGSR
ncbi:MAG: pitrilysin family protein [Acidobacteria bacterium]|nr:pitrilysin family protein [Acidobacteriota bacterium]